MRTHIVTDVRTGVKTAIAFTPEEEAAADAADAAETAKANKLANAHAEAQKPMPATVPGLAERLAALEARVAFLEGRDV